MTDTDTLKERRARWADRLESGQYPQATGALKVNDRFCCLGVACEQYREETGDGEWVEARGEVAFRTPDGDESWSALPLSVARWFGLTDEEVEGFGVNPELPAEGIEHPYAAHLNDNLHWTFPEIAQAVRKL